MELLSKIVKSQAFKEILRVLVALLAGYASSGCNLASLPAPRAAELAVFECQLAAFEAVVPRALAEDVLAAARVGNFEYVVVQLRSLKLSAADIQAVAQAFDACRPAPVEPEPAEPAAPLTRS